jgi:hypothetical protein
MLITFAVFALLFWSGAGWGWIVFGMSIDKLYHLLSIFSDPNPSNHSLIDSAMDHIISKQVKEPFQIRAKNLADFVITSYQTWGKVDSQPSLFRLAAFLKTSNFFRKSFFEALNISSKGRGAQLVNWAIDASIYGLDTITLFAEAWADFTGTPVVFGGVHISSGRCRNEMMNWIRAGEDVRTTIARLPRPFSWAPHVVTGGLSVAAGTPYELSEEQRLADLAAVEKELRGIGTVKPNTTETPVDDRVITLNKLANDIRNNKLTAYDREEQMFKLKIIRPLIHISDNYKATEKDLTYDKYVEDTIDKNNETVYNKYLVNTIERIKQNVPSTMNGELSLLQAKLNSSTMTPDQQRQAVLNIYTRHRQPAPGLMTFKDSQSLLKGLHTQISSTTVKPQDQSKAIDEFYQTHNQPVPSMMTPQEFQTLNKYERLQELPHYRREETQADLAADLAKGLRNLTHRAMNYAEHNTHHASIPIKEKAAAAGSYIQGKAGVAGTYISEQTVNLYQSLADSLSAAFSSAPAAPVLSKSTDSVVYNPPIVPNP